MARILIVEDDRAELSGLVELLTRAGYEVEGASSFEEGRHALARTTPDVLIADIRLKAFNGLHLVILGRQTRPEMAAIAMSAYEDATLTAEARRQGAEFLIKPFDPAELLDLVGQIIARHALGNGRRWPRKMIPGGMPALAAEMPVTILDASYGGLRLEGAQRAVDALPTYFEVIVPALALSIRARSVWSLRQPSGVLQCGVAFAEGQPDTERQWRIAVDRMATC